VHLQINMASVDEKSKLSTAARHHARNGVGLSFGNRRDALIEIEQWQLKWSCHAQNSTLDVEIVPMGDEAASRRVKAKPCGSVTKGLPHIAKVVSAGGLQREANAIDTNKYVSITKLTRVEMLLLIAQQHQATHSKVNKSFVARQSQTMIGEPARTRRLQNTRQRR
jgi:hypothetical protein